MEQNPNINMEEKRYNPDTNKWESTGVKNFALTNTDSVEYAQFKKIITNSINNGIITPDEGEYLYNAYNVPY
jgi:hypothetical protein